MNRGLNTWHWQESGPVTEINEQKNKTENRPKRSGDRCALSETEVTRPEKYRSKNCRENQISARTQNPKREPLLATEWALTATSSCGWKNLRERSLARCARELVLLLPTWIGHQTRTTCEEKTGATKTRSGWTEEQTDAETRMGNARVKTANKNCIEAAWTATRHRKMIHGRTYGGNRDWKR
jgi:hypothetical protein